MNNPMEECPPEGIKQVTIKATMDDSGNWTVVCPEWRFKGQTKNLTRLLALLVAEIESHNEGYNEDFNTWAEKNGFPRLKAEHHPKKPKPLYGQQETRTPRVSLWQAPT